MDAFTSVVTSVAAWALSVISVLVLWLYSFFTQQAFDVPSSLPTGAIRLMDGALSLVDCVCPWTVAVSVIGGLVGLWIALWVVRVVWASVRLGIWLVGTVASLASKIAGSLALLGG